MAQTINKELTPQEICIQKHDGIYLVVAGPGVGKTYTIVKRIQEMINQGIEPDKILCLTFSDTASREMKSRIGDNNNVNVFTYHSFCLEIMEEFAEYFNMEGYKIISDSHKKTLINECIDEIQPGAYNNEKNNPYQYTDEILEGIEEIKKNRIKDEATFKYNLENNKAWKPRLEELLKEAEQQKKDKDKATVKLRTEIFNLSNKIARMEELWEFYELYNKKMRELGYIDFNDMINLVLNKFEDKTSPLLELIAEKYSHVIVDEYQDTNTAQNDIVFNLAKFIKNIFVVGDDDQIIYTFQGAHLDTVEKFLNYSEFQEDNKVNVLCFDKNYRSTQKILDLACSFAELQDNFYQFMLSKSGLKADEKNAYMTTPSPKLRFISKCKKNSKLKDDEGNLLSKKLTASNEDIVPLDKPVKFIEFSEKDNERDYIVQKIVELKNSVEKLSEIAILTRTNKELKDFATYLKANGVSIEITGGKNIFEINSVNCLITYLQFLVHPEKYSDKMLSFMLLQPYHIDPRDYKTLCDFMTHNDTLLNNIKCMIENAYDKEKLTNFIETYEYLQNYITGENYKNALIEIASKTGILKHYFNDEVNKLENIKGFKKLLDVSDAYFDIHKNQGNSFKLFVDYLTNLIESDSEIRLDKEDKPMNAVQLSTYHSSKGREFEYVFMPFLTKGKWESNSSSYKDLIPTTPVVGEDYNDILTKETQAKFLDNIKLLYVGITRAKHDLTLSYTKTDDAVQGKLSWFIQQMIDDEKLNDIFDKKQDSKLEIEYKLPEYEYDYKDEFRDYIVSKLPNKFSISGLNTYRNCPKQYFYNYILELKSSAGSQDNASFGTAMHSAFEYTIKEVMNNKKYPSADEAFNVFSKKLDTLICDLPENLKQSARIRIFSDVGYYSKFKALVDENSIDPNKKYEKNPKLDNTATGFHEIYAEYPLSFETEIEGHRIILKGFIDRLDKDKNGNYSIYDYKSKGKCDTISPSDNYFYQMAFYKYVFELQHPDCKVVNATFILPLEVDNNHQINLIDKFEKFAKTGKEKLDKTNYDVCIEELLNCIKGICNLEFDVPTYPKRPACEYCAYKQFCSSRTI